MDAHFYLAYRDNKIVGRIAYYQLEEVNNQYKKKVRFEGGCYWWYSHQKRY
jgi:hypothetical protein